VSVKESKVEGDSKVWICEVLWYVNAIKEVSFWTNHDAIDDHTETFILIALQSKAEVFSGFDDYV